MTGILSELPVFLVFAAVLVTGVAGFVKGTVGFAMPMVMISGLSTFLPADVALAALIVPTLTTNFLQALRHGVKAVVASVVQYRVFLLVGLVTLLASAQLYNLLPPKVLFACIGVPIVLFSIYQLAGKSFSIPPERRKRAEVIAAGFAGLSGGISGVWGPPTVAFLTAVGTEKSDQMRLQGIIYGLGAVALFGAHVQSGVVNARTLPFSIAMVVPAFIGMWLGMRVHDRMDAAKFRKVTLIVLVIAGGNLIRKSLI
ncbi:sulfite exporter TauE/SafE family protein [Actibacterium pelagium]|uniref:Probable membrane transporter protein n=1 Tax=Actibacterium pelagium TaxID=2029103 RepID=A0A917AFD4_9RHOB|nr:sulfite exporter TauE/SafE family protein [Actibacterium pelagium]GGE49013.1 membrane protein [Actibacterium pelagium]